MARVYMSQYVVPSPPPVAGLIAYPVIVIPPAFAAPGLVIMPSGVPTGGAAPAAPPMMYLIVIPPIAHEWFE